MKTSKFKYLLNLQTFAGSTLYEMKDKLATVGAQLKAIEAQLVDKLANPAVPMNEITELKNQKNDLQERFNLLKEQHDKAETEQKAQMQRENPVAVAGNDKEKIIAAKAEFIRAAIQGRSVSQDAMDVFNALHALPAGNTTGGEKFLPTTLSNVLLSEPLVKNPLRGVIAMTNIKGLELPKISFTIADDDFITDEQTAKELALTGDKVTFGRFKFKIFAAISDTVIHGSDIDLVTYVENALRSGLAAKEKKVAFTAAPKVGEEHMSFYAAANGIAVVNGADKYKAIKAAIAALHEDYRDNASIMMTFADYSAIIETLANGSAALYNAQPEQVLGKPVIFSDSAADPIVGDFNYAHLNYDGDLVYETDKDVKSGDYLFVLTAWFDMQIKLKSAFRIAKVVVTP